MVWEVLPAGVLPAEERRLLGPEAADPWGPAGATRVLVRLLGAALGGGGTHVVLEHAGRLVLEAAEARGRLGNPDDAESRPFGAFIDWALMPDRSRYRTLGMGVAGGEDLEIGIVHPESEVELDSAESALLFACHLQVRGARLLDDGEVFYVPKDVRIGPRGASASSRTGYKYVVARPPCRARSLAAYGRESASFAAERSQAALIRSCTSDKRAPMTEVSVGRGRVDGPALRRPWRLAVAALEELLVLGRLAGAPGWTRRRRR